MPTKITQSEIQKTPKLRFLSFSGEWEEKKFRDVTKINQGLQIPISERFLKQVENSYFYITNEFLKENTQKEYYIKNPSESVLCNEGDILMTRTGNTGHVVTNVSGAFHNNFFKIKFDKNQIEKNFLYYFLTLPKTKNFILRLAGTSTIPDLNHGDFYKIKINFPSLSEQQKITGFLEATDEWVENLRAQKDNFELYKKGMMQKIFAQEIRFKDIKGNDFPKWDEKKLGEIEDDGLIKLGRGDVISKKDIAKTPGEYPIYSSSVKNDAIFGHYGKYIFDEELITWSVDGGGHFFYRPKHKFSITNVSGWMRILSKSLNCKFLSIQLQYLHQRKVFDYSSKAHPSVIRDVYKLKLPIYEEQQKIAEFLTSIDKLIESKQQQIIHAEQWKKGLMQGLFV